MGRPSAFKTEHSLARRLVRTVLAFYLGIAGFITLTQLSLEYRNEKKRLIEEVGHVSTTFKPIVMQALWNLDQEQINISLHAMLGTNSDILEVELKDKQGNIEYFSRRKPKVADPFTIEGFLDVNGFLPRKDSLVESYTFSYPLVFEDEYSGSQYLGDLVFITNSNVVLRRVAPIFYITLISALIKTMILSLIFVLVLNRMVGRPMNILSSAMRSLDPKQESFGGGVDYNGISPELLDKQDEIGVTLKTFQAMKEAIEEKDHAIGEYQAHLEEKIHERTQKMEEVFKAKSDFLANMSHEIRTPMNGVLGITKLLSETELDPKQRRYLEIIENSGSTLLKTINAILDHLKIEAGKVVLDYKPLCLETIVDDCTGLFSYQARSESIELCSIVDADCPEWVLGDSTRIQQVLTNLLSNAFKFTKFGGVTLHVSKLKSLDADRVKIRFLVKDTGIGIDQNKIGELFLPFSQADSSTTRNYGGTGLGLSISKQLTELMGGEVDASSVLRSGTSFWLDLPLKVVEPPADFVESRRCLISKLKDKKALLIGVGSTVTTQISEALQTVGVSCDTFVSGQDGLDLLAAGDRYDVVIVNHELPDMEGFTFVEELIDIAKSSVPGLLLLDFNECVDYSKTLKRRFSYIDTPITNSNLRHELLAIIEGSDSVALSAEEKVEKSYGHISVLVAEDNPVNQMVITGLLHKLGVNVEVADNGRKAVEFCEKAQDRPYDLILMDCEMPVMDGWNATKLIRKNRYQGSDGAPVLIYALSAHTKDKFLDEANSSGMDGYLFKPIVVDQLIEIFEKIS